MRNRRVIGQYRQQLAQLLQAEGFNVDPSDFIWTRGYWAHRHQDCERWSIRGTALGRTDVLDGMDVGIYSWDTITDCARRGIEIGHYDRDLVSQFIAYAKPCKKKE